MSTYYRIQSAGRDVADLLTAEGQTSTNWCDADDVRQGVSVCESIEELAAYLVTTGIPFGEGEWVLVELEGDFIGYCADDQPLVIPTSITSVQTLDDADFWTALDAAYDQAA